MLARRLAPTAPQGRSATPALERAQGKWRRRGQEPTRGPSGDVRWWERPAPRGDVALWEAVQRCQSARIARGLTVAEVTRALAGAGRPLSRETVSRVLNGKQATSWETVETLADLLDVDVWDLLEADACGATGADEPAATVVSITAWSGP